MKIGTTCGYPTIEGLAKEMKQHEEYGFSTTWVSNLPTAHDALSVCAGLAHETSSIQLGTFVIPTYPRHPVVMAQAALTTNAVAGGRFKLGIGLSHPIIIESFLGLKYERPVRHMREYLEILMPLVEGEPAAHKGEIYDGVEVAMLLEDHQKPPVYVAALGPQMLRVAGRLADGTVPLLAGKVYLESTVVPEITKAASEAGRPAPLIAAALPVVVTDDVEAGRAVVNQTYSMHATMPSYARAIEASKAETPADVAIIGNEEEVRKELLRLRDIGVTEIVAEVMPGEDRDRAMAFLGGLGDL